MSNEYGQMPPTPRQARALAVFVEHYRRTGVPPTLREWSGALGRSSSGAGARFARALVAKGHLAARGSTVGHTMVPVVPEGHCPCCGQKKPADPPSQAGIDTVDTCMKEA